MTRDLTPPQAVLDTWSLDPAATTMLTGGLINRSFRVRRRDGTDCVLQRVNPIFPPAVQRDIEAVTQHLAARGMTTPRLLPTPSGALQCEHDGAVWRLLTLIEGATYESVADAAMASEAGRMLGAFHAALADFATPLAAARPGVHDLARHLAHLERTLAARQDHPAHAEVATLAARVVALAATLPALGELPPRLVHGDPKISNVIFAGGRAVCLVDLDTITRQPVALELGDALRSWCNPAAEDSPDAHLSVGLYEAALAGYRSAAGDLFDPATRAAVPDATMRIAVELAARFAADALNESYFGWDEERFGSASAHNRARAEAQLGLAESIRDALGDLRALAVTQP